MNNLLIYFNPDDPAIFVDKTSGLGQTLNFGHPVSWVIAGVTLVLVILLVIKKYRKKS